MNLNVRHVDEELSHRAFGYRFYARIVAVNNEVRHFRVEVDRER